MVSRVYLIPGFFGFAHFGDLKYFHHVEELLTHELAGLGRNFQVIRVDTLAAGTLGRRTDKLREFLQQTAAGDHDPIHLVGHSTGALDARRLLDPERVRDVDDELVSRVRSVVSISGAHRGTPLASAFRGAFGKDVLRALGTLTVQALRLGPISIGSAMAVAGLLALIDRTVGERKSNLIAQIEQYILRDFSDDKRATLEAFFSELTVDQGLLDELSPDVARHADQQTRDRDGVSYACVVTMAARPTAHTALSLGLSPYAQASHAIFHALWNLSSRFVAEGGMPKEAVDAHRLLKEQLGRVPDQRDNDGIVPVLSQFHGRLLRAVSADHHDVIGHFDGGQHSPSHADWLISRSGFRQPQFDSLWRDVARFIVDADGGDPIA